MLWKRSGESPALNKLTYGPTRADRDQIRKLGISAWLADQLDPTKPEDPAVAANLALFRALPLDIPTLQVTLPYSISAGYVADELAQTTLYRRMKSSRQTFETLVEFLSDYVPVPLHNEPIYRLSYDRDVIRKNALGTYPQLLWDAAMHPAMLRFLSGYANTKQHPNENFGREVLELFTVTTATPYTQDDVVNAARVFSGIYYDDKLATLVAAPTKHWNGAVKVLDWTDPNPGTTAQQILDTAQSLIMHLALMPETATAFARRTARRYATDKPSDDLVKTLAAQYLTTSGSIPQVLTALVNHRDFIASAGSKLKRPAEHIISSVRVLGVELQGSIQPGDLTLPNYFKGSNLNRVVGQARQQGHLPFDWDTPDGYPDTEPQWTTMAAQVMRWNTVTQLTLGTAGYNAPDWITLYAGVPDDLAKIIEAASLLIIGTPVSGPNYSVILDRAKLAISLLPKNLTGASLWAAKCRLVTQLMLSTEDWSRR